METGFYREKHFRMDTHKAKYPDGKTAASRGVRRTTVGLSLAAGWHDTADGRLSAACQERNQRWKKTIGKTGSNQPASVHYRNYFKRQKVF
ncbi:hypothetical protein TRIP_B40198 [uncultured Desulfatiglans sp.]|nr:hypothetical protein TRIP_B40198 [uncultured Desulfatiglans sp.]